MFGPIGIPAAGKDAVHLGPLHVEAKADLVQVLELLVPEQEINAGYQHRHIV
jgi:hypothetical protein